MYLRVSTWLLCMLTGWCLQAADPVASYDLATGAVDLTGNHLPGTIISCKPTQGPREKMDAVSMRPDSRISLPVDLSHVSEYTMSLWVNKLSTGDSFFLYNDGWFQGFGLGWGWPKSTSKEHLVFFAGDGTRWVKADAQTSLTGTGWHHLAGTVNRRGEIRLYLDGLQIASASSPMPLCIVPGSPTILSCSGMTATNGESCRMSGVTFHDRALSPKEIARLADGKGLSWLPTVRVAKFPILAVALIWLILIVGYRTWKLIRNEQSLPQDRRRRPIY